MTNEITAEAADIAKMFVNGDIDKSIEKYAIACERFEAPILIELVEVYRQTLQGTKSRQEALQEQKEILRRM